MTRRIAIIPARGGSKRIPKKNIRDFFGKPVIAYTLQAAKTSGLFDVIHVSTDDAEVCKTVEKLGFQIDFMRPKELADDLTPIMPVLKYVVDTYATKDQLFEQVWLLMPCAPFICDSDLQQAAVRFELTEGADQLVAVTEYPAPIEWAFSISEDNKLTPVQPGLFAMCSQDLEKKYFDSGSFAAFTVKSVQTLQGLKPTPQLVGYVLPKGRAIDIDDEADWALAEAMYRVDFAL